MDYNKSEQKAIISMQEYNWLKEIESAKNFNFIQPLKKQIKFLEKELERYRYYYQNELEQGSKKFLKIKYLEKDLRKIKSKWFYKLHAFIFGETI
ncbi:MAG: hypothetical protein ACFFG0_42355 [Candidatus Thorarchaeota archaeon]